jgi:cell division septum initiation protein DivIVA
VSKISQREARRLQKRVDELEEQINKQHRSWSSSYPGGTHIATTTYAAETDFLPAIVKVSRQLGHAVVVVNDGTKLLFYGLPLPVKP